MLIPRNAFIGIDDVVHLAAGGETPMLRSHRAAVERFIADKAVGEAARHRLEATYKRAQRATAALFDVDPDSIAFLASSSEGINLLAHALPWQAGDNVVVADVEFASDVLPWTRLADRGVATRVVRHRDWVVHLEEIIAAIDARTRLVAVSVVSYFTGQRLPLAELAARVHERGALLCVDATHAAGVIPVAARQADFLVCSCYKWLLGVHGTAVFYWNRARVPDLAPPFLGWHTGAAVPDWRAPTDFTPHEDATRFVPGNPAFLSLYILENALAELARVGIPAIESHVARLSQRVWDGLATAGWPLMTSGDPALRAGNVCFMSDDIEAITTGLAERGVLIWGGYAGVGRIRVSTHLYNSDDDVARFLAALGGLPVRPAPVTGG